MIALLVGLVLIAAAIVAMLPMGLNWWSEVVLFLKGSVPVVAVLIGLLAVVIGIADIKDQIEAKKEESEEEKKKGNQS
ncbi:MAG: hypothetical protein N2Z76_04410 [Treponemataceae bacterium]|nr:hypothetical protein [Treponemataceae bacterium]